jgi:hypothetical protein
MRSASHSSKSTLIPTPKKTTPHHPFQTIQPKAGDSSTVKYELKNALESGCTLQVCLGDLTKSNADLIVNAANASLQHASGLSGAIKKVAGQAIQDVSADYIKRFGKVLPGECMVTAGYRQQPSCFLSFAQLLQTTL